MQRQIFLLICLIGLPLSSSIRAAVLQENTAFDTAKEHNAALQKAKEKLEEQELRVIEAGASTLPTIGATASYVIQKDSAAGTSLFGGDSYNIYKYAITANQPLFQRGLFAGLSSARQDVQIAKIDLELGEWTLLEQSLGALWKLSFQRKITEILQSRVKIQTDLVRAVERRVRTGTDRDIKYLQVQTNLALLESRLQEAESKLQDAAAELATALGKQNPAELIAQVDNLRRIRSQEWIARLKVKAQTPIEKKKIELKLSQWENNAIVAGAEHWPTMALVGSWGLTTTDQQYLFDSNYFTWSVGVQLSVPLFSGFSSWPQRKSMASQRSQLQLEKRDIDEKLLLESTQSLRDIDLKEKLLMASQKARDLAEKTWIRSRRDYELGNMDFSGLANAQDNWLDAENSVETAKLEFLKSSLRYSKAIGLSAQDYLANLY